MRPKTYAQKKHIHNRLRIKRKQEEKKKIRDHWDFPGSSVVRNLTASAGDMGSIPGPGNSHML